MCVAGYVVALDWYLTRAFSQVRRIGSWCFDAYIIPVLVGGVFCAGVTGCYLGGGLFVMGRLV